MIEGIRLAYGDLAVKTRPKHCFEHTLLKIKEIV